MVTFYPSSWPAAEFEFTLDGDAVSDGSMDVRDFAPALLALGQTFERANFLLNSDSASVDLRVVGTRQGSFGIELMLSQMINGDVLNADNLKTVLDLKELIIGGGTGAAVFELLKRLRGRRLDRVEHHSGDGIVINIDNLTMNVTPDSLKLLDDDVIRARLKEVVEPLQQQGISRISFSENGAEIDSVEEDESVFFQVQTNDETINEFIIPRQALTVISPVFNRAGKWRLNDGLRSNWYTMSDERFLTDVGSGNLRFGENDLLICRVKSTQWQDGAKLRSNLEIIAVLGLQTVEGENLIDTDDSVVIHTLSSRRESLLLSASSRLERPRRRIITE